MLATVVVMGVSGSGKSTVGAALARRLDVPYADADDFHPESNTAKMRAGRALDDHDRHPWLAAVGVWLAQHPDGAVVGCSALKRRYRDQLRRHGAVDFLHLVGDPALIERRQAGRDGHFMPTALLGSQLADLETLHPDEHGIAITIEQPVDAIVEEYVAARGLG